MTKIPTLLNTSLWDTDPSKLDIQKHKEYIVERILEFGDIPQINWMFSTYKKQDIVEVLKKSKRISEKSGNFFYIILNLNEPEENFECLRKPYTQKQNRF